MAFKSLHLFNSFIQKSILLLIIIFSFSLFSGEAKAEAGNFYTVQVKSDGTLWSWGLNDKGQLGLGDLTDRNVPVQVGSDSDWKSISAGGHSLAIKSDGTLWSWGLNDKGQLGLGDLLDRNVPVQVGSDTDWQLVSGGDWHSLAIKTDGTLWSWGNNLWGMLGDGTTTGRTSPVQVGSDTDWQSVSVGGGQSLGIKTNGTLWSWGYNAQGQLGLGDSIYRDVPNQVGSDTDWQLVSGGDSYSLAKKTGGTLWSWGMNVYGQLGLGDLTSRNVPVQVGSDTNWQSVSAGGEHSLAIKLGGTLWSWGRNEFGELGLGDSTNRNVPNQVGSDTDWQFGSGGETHSLAIKTGGTLWSWGNNAQGELGLGDSTDRNIPTQVGSENLWGIAISSVSAGDIHTLQVKGDGTLWSCGANADGQLGLGDSGSGTNRNSFVQVGTDTGWHSVTGGSFHSFAIKTDGTLWAWGQNIFGQLGLGDTTSRDVPVQVGSDSDWQYISAGVRHSVAVKTDGTLWVWGSNSNSQLGLGDLIDRNVPNQVGSDSDWQFISGGNMHSLAIKTGGTLWSWGYNGLGRLGLGDSTDRNVPVQIGGDTNWQSVSAGGDHSLSIKVGGTLWSWGANGSGQLGQGDATSRSVPTQVGSDTNWQFLSAGYSHSLVIKTDSTLWSWGSSTWGQLGLGDITNRNQPEQIGSDSDWQYASTGGGHSLVIKADSTLWRWGRNIHGQLGLGHTTEKHLPTNVSITSDSTAPITSASATGGYYNSTQSVTLTCVDGAGSGCDKTYYTTDGTIPTTGSTQYSSPISISTDSTLKFFSTDLDSNSESVVTETYIFDSVAPTSIADPTGGTYSTVQSVNLSCDDSAASGCDKTYYTTDGTTPTISSTEYGSAISISVNTTLKFFSTDLASNSGTVITETYVITAGDSTPPTTSASSTGGTYSAVQSVTLTCVDGGGSGCDKTYYTTDGTTPTISSTEYSSAISISVNTTLKFFSTDLALNAGSVVTETYIVNIPDGLTYESVDDGTGDSTDTITGVSRNDGGNDGDNLVSGRPSVDVGYTFSIFMKDSGGTPDVFPTLYISHKSNASKSGGDFFPYNLTCTANPWSDGNTCSTVLTLGPAAVNSHYFYAKKNNLAEVFQPTSALADTGPFSTGPSVRTMHGYNMLGVARDVTGDVLTGSSGFGSTIVYRWISNAVDPEPGVFYDGGWQVVNESNPAVTGEGYFVYRQTSKLPELSSSADVVAASYTYALSPGWNIITNPYNGYVPLSAVVIEQYDNSLLTTTPNSWADAATASWVVNAIYYYTNSDTYLSETDFDGVLAPWRSYWIYLGDSDTDNDYSLIITKP